MKYVFILIYDNGALVRIDVIDTIIKQYGWHPEPYNPEGEQDLE